MSQAASVINRTIGAAETLQVVAVAAAVLLTIWLLSDVITAIFLAVLVAVILRSLTNRVVRWTHLPAAVTLVLVNAILGMIFGWLGYRIEPTLLAEGQDLWSALTAKFESLHGSHDAPWVQWMFRNFSTSPMLRTHIESIRWRP
jgi:predicted PurR-regulated permease PerM